MSAKRKSEGRLQEEWVRLPGYTITDKLFESSRSLVFRALRERDGQHVVIKILQEDYLSRMEIARYRHEFEISRRIISQRVVSALSLEEYQGSPMIVFEDFGGRSLAACPVQSMNMTGRLEIAIAIASAIGDVHSHKVIHKDINPSNIIFNEKSGILKLTDFGLSTILLKEQAVPLGAGVLEGSLSYMSPEQTGRMNRSVDYRSDLYSLGVTLFELFAGRLPFVADGDSLRLIHHHIAKQPASPCAVNPAVPPVLGEIILRLMAKNVEDRYQSCWGVREDLRRCLDMQERHGRISSFSIGSKDIPDRFYIPEKLYGREDEVQTLLRSFERVCEGRREMMLVSGYSGIGKTSLISEIYKPITGHRGYFVSGKFDQLGRNTPYSALVEAFRELIRQILGESEDQLMLWKTRLMEALGPNGSVITDVIPEVELILGEQEPVPRPGSEEAQRNRFNTVFTRFVSVFCHNDHPLALFLDDLQWIDSSSLQLITHLVGHARTRYLYFIGTYRANEVDETHPLTTTLQDLSEMEVRINSIHLRPLGFTHVKMLIGDALRQREKDVEPLARLVLDKTGGNPFFVEEFLRTLVDRGLLQFSPDAAAWTWDQAGIEETDMTDNVVDLLSVRITGLGNDARDILKFAACVGHHFDLSNLAMISQINVRKLVPALEAAMAAGLITCLSPVPLIAALDTDPSVTGEQFEFRFTHDRIQQAAYALIADAERCIIHQEVGRLLLEKTPADERPRRIFDIVNHLNFGIDQIGSREERLELSLLNLDAGRRARDATAYEAAYGYFQAGIRLLDQDSWLDQYSHTLEIHTEMARVCFLAGQFKDLESVVNLVVHRARTLLDQIPVHEARIHAAIARNEMQEAAAMGRSLLKKLGSSYPEKPSVLRIGLALLRSRLSLFRAQPDDFIDNPRMTDELQLAKINLQFALAQCVYFTQPRLIPLLVFDALRESRRYGNAPVSSYIYSCYGMIVTGVLGRIEEGIRWGNLGYRVYDQLNARRFEAPLLVSYNIFLRHWKEPVRQTLRPLQRAWHAGLETGDQEFACHAAMAYCYHSFFSGREIEPLTGEIDHYQEAISGLNQKGGIYILGLFRQVMENLLEPGAEPWNLQGPWYNEIEMLQRHLDAGDETGIFATHFVKMYLCYMFGRFAQAADYAALAEPHMESVLGTIYVPLFCTWQSLALLAGYQGCSRRRQRRILQKVKRNQKKLKEWASACPANSLHRFYMVGAELNRVLGNHLKAQKRYDLAINLARKNAFIQDHAMANEMAARYYLEEGKMTIAVAYMKKARYSYDRWGALARVNHLDDTYPQLMAQAQGGRSLSSSTSTMSASTIDINTLKKALMAIAEENVHSKMIERILSSAMEFAGAQKGMLLLRKDKGEFFLEAEGSIDADGLNILQSVPLDECENLPMPVINFVRRAKKFIVIDNAQVTQERLPGLTMNPYIREEQVKSILCVPIKTGVGAETELVGILYLENNRAQGSFTAERIEILEIICLAAAGRLELSFKASTDGLTGLYNHEYFQDMLGKELVLSRRQLRDLSVIMVDIDHFKSFNDQWGHQVGDLVLKKVANAIQTACRKSDIVARYGGEEMSVILPETSPERAAIVAERIRRKIEDSVIHIEDQVLKVTASLGVASLNDSCPDPGLLLQDADKALYQSKNAGRNKVTMSS